MLVYLMALIHVICLQVPGVQEFDAQIESDLLDISEEQLNEKFAECSQLQTSDLGGLHLFLFVSVHLTYLLSYYFERVYL